MPTLVAKNRSETGTGGRQGSEWEVSRDGLEERGVGDGEAGAKSKGIGGFAGIENAESKGSWIIR